MMKGPGKRSIEVQRVERRSMVWAGFWAWVQEPVCRWFAACCTFHELSTADSIADGGNYADCGVAEELGVSPFDTAVCDAAVDLQLRLWSVTTDSPRMDNIRHV